MFAFILQVAAGDGARNLKMCSIYGVLYICIYGDIYCKVIYSAYNICIVCSYI